MYLAKKQTNKQKLYVKLAFHTNRSSRNQWASTLLWIPEDANPLQSSDKNRLNNDLQFCSPCSSCPSPFLSAAGANSRTMVSVGARSRPGLSLLKDTLSMAGTRSSSISSTSSMVGSRSSSDSSWQNNQHQMLKARFYSPAQVQAGACIHWEKEKFGCKILNLFFYIAHKQTSACVTQGEGGQWL